MGKGGKIDMYVDCNSPYSFIAYHHALANRPSLQQHDIEISIHPIFLGGIMHSTGNEPPWTLPAKATLGTYELARALRYSHLPPMTRPPCFPIRSQLPMRCMLYVQAHFPRSQYEAALGELWVVLWREHRDVSRSEVLAECLARHFAPEEVVDIVSAGEGGVFKEGLSERTDWLVRKGAFGAPWFLVTDREGVEEGFFGSDRWHFIYQFLGVPYQDLSILPPREDAAKL